MATCVSGASAGAEAQIELSCFGFAFADLRSLRSPRPIDSFCQVPFCHQALLLQGAGWKEAEEHLVQIQSKCATQRETHVALTHEHKKSRSQPSRLCKSMAARGLRRLMERDHATSPNLNQQVGLVCMLLACSPLVFHVIPPSNVYNT